MYGCASMVPWKYAIVAVTMATLVGCSGGGSTRFVPTSTTSRLIPGRVVELSASSGDIVRDLLVGPDPLLAVGADDSVWTVNLDDSTVSRIDATTGEVTSPSVGEVVGIAAEANDVWIARDGNEIAKLDGSTGEVRASFSLADHALFGPRDAGFLVVAAGSVWLTVPEELGSGAPQSLWRIDPATGDVLSTIRIGADPLPPALVGDEIWLATGDMVFQLVDVRSERVRELDLGPFPGFATAGGGRTWASAAGRIYSIDPQTGKVRSSFEHLGESRGLAWVAGRLWISTATGVEVVDPETGAVERSIGLAPPSDDEGPIALVPLGDSVWVSIETQ
jgi:outer membrane protein assembly factor BamB